MINTRRAILCLLLGLASTIVIAFLLAAFRPIPMYPRTALRFLAQWDRPWQLAEVDPIGVHDIWWYDLSQNDPRTTSEILQSIQSDGGERTNPLVPILRTPPFWGTLTFPKKTASGIGSDTAFGLPLPCLWYSITADTSNAGGAPGILNHKLHGGLLLRGDLSARGRDFAALPLRPIWSRLAINTVAFACFWWLLLFLPDPIRRALRRRRGHCPRCNYDLRATPAGSPCPECGHQRAPKKPAPVQPLQA